MADEQPIVAPVQPVAAAVDTLVVPAPSSSVGDSVVAASPAPATVEPVVAPVADPAKPTDVSHETPKADEPAPSLLSELAKDEPEAPAEGDKPAVEAKPEVIPLPVYEALKLPEGVTFDAQRLGQLDAIVGQFELSSKADHAATQALRQQLTDLHLEETKRFAEAQKHQWENLRDEWRGNFRKDKDLGGSREKTTLNRCYSLIEEYGGSRDQIAEIRSVLSLTGAGDHPAVIRLLANASKALTEAPPGPVITNKTQAPTSKSARRYGNNANSMNGAA